MGLDMKRSLLIVCVLSLCLLICGCVAGVRYLESHTINNITVTVSNVNYIDTGANTPAVDTVNVTIKNNQSQAIILTTDNFALYNSSWLDHTPFAPVEIPIHPDFDNKYPIILVSGESGNYTLHMLHSTNNQKTFSFIPDGVFGHDSISWDLNIYGD